VFSVMFAILNLLNLNFLYPPWPVAGRFDRLDCLTLEGLWAEEAVR
jgi:hypothetical protein